MTDQDDHRHMMYRIEKVEEHTEDLLENKNKLSDAILLLGVKIENGIADLSQRVKQFEEKRAFWNKVLIGILIASAMALISQVFRISYMVQSNKITPGGE